MDSTDPRPSPTTPDQDATLRQLGHLLVHPAFQRSQRCTKLLRFLVEQALTNPDFHPKERTLGVEVFGRKPDYDTAADPVVRTTANEIRKRLGAYYHDAGAVAGVYIDLPSGSYLPVFRAVVRPAEERRAEPNGPRARLFAVLGAPRHWVAACGGALLIGIGCALLIHERSAQSNFNRFWRPFLTSSRRVLVCPPNTSGDAARADASPAKASFHPVVSQDPTISLTDTKAVWRILSVLDQGQESVSFRTSDCVQVSDLQDGPAVLIGAPENTWSAMLMSQLRFQIVAEAGGHALRVVDQQSPSDHQWSVDSSSSSKNSGYAYAVVSRVTNAATANVIIDVSGIGAHATAAAGDFIAQPAYLNALGKRLSACDRNLQLVLRVPYNGRVVEAPVVEAVHCW